MTSRSLLTGALLSLGLAALAGCVHNPPKVYGAPATSPSPDKPWTPPAKVLQAPAPAAAPAPAIPQDILERSQNLTLLDVVDIALRNSPLTAEAWAQARSAAAAYGSQKGSYYPQIQAQANYNRAEGSLANGAISYYQRSYEPQLSLSWLLYNFGGQTAAVDEKRQALISADFSHNAMLQNVTLAVEQAYYQYVAAKALYKAQEETVKEAQTNLDAAQAMHKAGVATIADVLQAKTSLAQAQLILDGLEGQIQTTRGALATAMGLPANTPYDVGIPSKEPKTDQTFQAVDKFLAQAEVNRPDLSAARALAEKAAAHVRTVKAEGRPSLNGSASLGRIYYDSKSAFGNTYNLGVVLSIPLFTGFTQQYNVIQAKADEDAANANLSSLQQEVTFQVWSSYYQLRTAKQQVKTSHDLLESATESHDVALGRYKAGVGSILDLLSAQSALASARAQRVQADANWYMALAQLAHDTGTLTVADQHSELAAPVAVEKDKKP
ncbi:MAG: TolC family protein [Acidobacteriota bacterium]